jgi:hypothetical protein
LGKKGKWQDWLKEYCPQIFHRTANVYMKLAKHKDKFTDETNSQRAAIKALELDFGVGGAISIVNAEDEKKKNEEPTDSESESESDESDSECDDEAEDEADDETLKQALVSANLTSIFKHVAPDEVFIALKEAWDREQLRDLVNRLLAYFRENDLSIPSVLQRPLTPAQPSQS